MEPILVTLKHDGTSAVIFHPDTQVGLADAIATTLGKTVESRRGGHVLPQGHTKRAAFRIVRRLFGSGGWMADWTRTWRGPWIVIRADNGNRLPGSFPTHAKAVQAEVAMIQQEMI